MIEAGGSATALLYDTKKGSLHVQDFLLMKKFLQLYTLHAYM